MSEVVREATAETVDGDCPECDGNVVHEGAERLCRSCGLVLQDSPIDHGPEWRNFDDQPTDPRRTGPPRTETVHDSGIGSEIGMRYDANNNTVDGGKLRRLNRQRIYHSRARFDTKRDRNRAHAFGEIHRLCCALGIDDGRRGQACRLFKSAQDADLLFGHSLEGMAAAAIYATARLNGDHLKRADVERVARVDRNEIDNAYTRLNTELGLPTPPPAPRQYLGRIVGELEVDDACRRRAAKLLDAGGDLATGGPKPAGVAAGAVYLATRELNGRQPTQAAVGEAAGVSALTVRERRDDLEDAVVDGGREA